MAARRSGQSRRVTTAALPSLDRQQGDGVGPRSSSRVLMTTFAEQGLDRANIWISCHRCRRGMFLYADHPIIADRETATTRFRCQACGMQVEASYMDPRGFEDPHGWTVMDMNGPEPVPMPLLTATETALARNGVAIRRPRDPERLGFR
jgi:hypothetical protein